MGSSIEVIVTSVVTVVAVAATTTTESTMIKATMMLMMIVQRDKRETHLFLLVSQLRANRNGHKQKKKRFADSVGKLNRFEEVDDDDEEISVSNV